jgi:hypothetical protein
MALLRLQREPSDGGATLGALYLNDVWQCWTLEDAIREPSMQTVQRALTPPAWVATWKVPGKTAIPAGRYTILLTLSHRFKIVLPELVGVPGFSGIRIHVLNVSTETEGCIGVGRVRAEAKILESRIAMDALMLRLQGYTKDRERIAIDIFNPPASHLTLPNLPPATPQA